MTTHKLSSEDLRHIYELAKRWGKIVVRRQWGDQGPGLDVDLDQMEEVAVAALHGLLAGTLGQATEQQARRLGSQQVCPDCGRVCPLTTEERTVQARGGPFEHSEPKGHCPVCRRDFFPSTAGVAARQPRL